MREIELLTTCFHCKRSKQLAYLLGDKPEKKKKNSNTSISEFNSVYLRKILTSLTPFHLDYFSFIFLIIEVVALYVCCLFIKFLWLNAAREETDMFRLEIQS